MINRFLYFILIIINLPLFAQFEFGGHPINQDWKKLSSPNVRVIYPRGMDSTAQRIANIINAIDSIGHGSVGKESRRIDIVLHTQTVTANGYVALAPYRSEFFTTPPESNALVGSLNWTDVLAIHEYRHALQMINARGGIVDLLYAIGGETFWSAANGLVIPSWYYEGDAVITETALTNAGRGRTAFFTMEQRALARADINFTYDKHRNGSFKSIVPNHYQLGYMMLTTAREKQGNEIGARVLKDASRYRPILYSFSRSMKRYVGLSTPNLYDYSWNKFKLEAAKVADKTAFIPTTKVTENNKRTPTNYSFPKVLSDGSIIARKTSYKQTTHIVKIKNGKESHITTIGYNQDNYLAYESDLLAWTENTKDSRRAYQTYSDVITYDLTTNKKKRLTKHTRYFSPSISPDRAQIAVINIDLNQDQALYIIDAQSGEVVVKIPNPSKMVFSRTAWSGDGKSIISIAKIDGLLQVVKIDIATGFVTALSPWTAHILDNPIVDGNWVYFNADFSGIDNIYAVNLNGDKNVFQITSVPIGAHQPFVFGDELYFTEYSVKGHYLSKQIFKSDKEIYNVDVIEPIDMPQYITIANQSEGGNILESLSINTYDVKSYHGLFRGMKLHTWSFNPFRPKPSVSVEMVNLMNELKIVAGTGINFNENNFKSFNTEIVFGRYYPEITFRGAQTKRSADYYVKDSYTLEDQLKKLEFDETTLGLSVGVPLNWLKGNYSTVLNPSIGFNTYKMTNLFIGKKDILNSFRPQLPNATFSAFDYGFDFSILRRKAYQNLNSRLGFTLKAKVNSTIDGSDANKTFIHSQVFLPGIGRNHSININVGYQKEALKNIYQFEDQFTYVRGYALPINDEIKSLSLNYQLPLFYPDFGILGITYFKRIRANIFYDYSESMNVRNNDLTVLSSMGYEFIFDNNYLNVIPLSVGIRTSYVIDPKKPSTRKPVNGFFFQVGF